jgi:ribosome silencing factor RsfS/YbeB/iojap
VSREADLKEVLEMVDEKKAMDVVVLHASDIERMRVLCDYMVIVTCTGRRHMKIVAEHVVDHFRLKGMLIDTEDEAGNTVPMPPSIEDPASEEWMLVDLQHVIVQIFSREGREKVCMLLLRVNFALARPLFACLPFLYKTLFFSCKRPGVTREGLTFGGTHTVRS